MRIPSPIATGSCDCVGMMGPGLGGGYGRHQGLYGLISDNIVNLNVVLANGTAVRVNETSYTDLFWAMKGAGHNFGIVTSFQLRIYPRQIDTWHYHNYVWRGEKLEELFAEANRLHANGNTPVDMALNLASFTLDTTISETEVSPGHYFRLPCRGRARIRWLDHLFIRRSSPGPSPIADPPRRPRSSSPRSTGSNR